MTWVCPPSTPGSGPPRARQVAYIGTWYEASIYLIHLVYLLLTCLVRAAREPDTETSGLRIRNVLCVGKYGC